jgi:hypothetical protein
VSLGLAERIGFYRGGELSRHFCIAIHEQMRYTKSKKKPEIISGVKQMEYLRETIDSRSLTGIFNLPSSLRNRNVEVIILPTENDRAKPRRKSAKGRLSKYANTKLIPLEKEAWVKAAEEKYADR